MGLFHPDSKFSIISNTILDYVKLGLLFILFSLPIVTIGASATAVMYVGMKMERGEAPAIWAPFRESFLGNFKQAVIVTIMGIILTLILCFDWFQIMQMEDTLMVKIVRGITFLVTLVVFMSALYVFPLIARFEQTLKQLVRNAVIFGISNITKNLVVILILIAGWGLLYYAIPIAPIIVVATPALGIFYMSKICVKSFHSSEEATQEEA